MSTCDVYFLSIERSICLLSVYSCQASTICLVACVYNIVYLVYVLVFVYACMCAGRLCPAVELPVTSSLCSRVLHAVLLDPLLLLKRFIWLRYASMAVFSHVVIGQLSGLEPSRRLHRLNDKCLRRDTCSHSRPRLGIASCMSRIVRYQGCIRQDSEARAKSRPSLHMCFHGIAIHPENRKPLNKLYTLKKRTQDSIYIYIYISFGDES